MENTVIGMGFFCVCNLVEKDYLCDVKLIKKILFMGKMSKEEKALVDKDFENLFQLLLKKTGWSYKKLMDFYKQEFVMDNVGELTLAEKQQFKHLAL